MLPKKQSDLSRIFRVNYSNKEYMMKEYSVRSYGAVGDGISLDSVYAQEALDDCRSDGGGTVVFPSGTYYCGGMRIYSNTTVRLEEGAVLIPSDDPADYSHLRGRFDQYFERDAMKLIGREEKDCNALQFMYLQGTRGATDTLFYCQDAENVTICGPGKIDGQWQRFYVVDPNDPHYNDHSETHFKRWAQRVNGGMLFQPKGFRPQMVVMRNVRHLELRDFTIVDSPFFNVHVVSCEDVLTDNVTILSDIHCVNTDGLNYHHCRHLVVQNCSVRSGDDCVALSGNMDDVLVENVETEGSTALCRCFIGIDEYLQAMFLGMGSKEKEERSRNEVLQNITFRNCCMKKGGAFLFVYAAYGKVHDIRVENCRTYQESGDTAIFLCVQADGSIKNIAVDGFESEATGVLTFMGNETPASIQNVSVKNANFLVHPQSKLFGNGVPDPVHQYFIAPWLPYNFYVRHASGLVLENVTITWEGGDLSDIDEIADASLRPREFEPYFTDAMLPNPNFPALDFANVRGLSMTNVRCEGHGDAPAMRMVDVRE